MMTSTTRCEPGAVVLVLFRFTRGKGVKHRPAVILSTDAYHASRKDCVMVALSAQPTTYFGDCDIQDWPTAGLHKPTKSKGVIQTVAQSVVDKRLGTLSARDLESVKDSVRTALNL